MPILVFVTAGLGVLLTVAVIGAFIDSMTRG